MRKALFFILPCLLLPLACAFKNAKSGAVPSIALEVVQEGISKPYLVTRGHRGAYFLAFEGKDQKAEIARIRKTESETLFAGLDRPGAIAFDARWGRLFVSDGGVVRIYRPGKPKEAPKEFSIPEAKKVTSITYSRMNARAYLSDETEKKLWVLHPKKGEVKQLLGPADFEKVGEGEPRHLRISADGKQIYIILFRSAIGEKPMESTLTTYDLHRQKFEKIQSFPGLELDGVEIYRSHFMLGDRVTGEVYTLSMRDQKVKKLPSPPFWKGPAIGFLMDLQKACFLVPEIGEEKGRLVRFYVYVKD